MQFKTISSFIEFVAWFLNKYQKQQTAQNIYRLIDLKQLPTGQHKLIIQVIGKSIVIEHSPQEVVANDQILEGFSKKEIRLITYIACEQRNKPRYKIVMQEFCNKFNRILFKLKKYDSDEMISRTASQISLDKNIINHLSREDVCSIIYTAGYEHSFSENLHQE